MRKVRSHLLFLLFTFLVGFSVLRQPAQASIADWIRTQFNAKESSENMNASLTQEGVSGEKHVTETTSNLMGVINMHVLGPSGDPNKQSVMLRENIGPGLINTVNRGIVAMYDPPASSQTYLADVLQHAKIIPEAQAQGLGFASLDPILETWKAFRNLAYLFFVIIFLVIGFMIMFRSKMGQAAITVQQAIPSIIVALLAVTFSYAIAGFLIDLMYVLMYMISGLFSQGSDLIDKNIFGLVGLMFNGFGSDVQSAVQGFMTGLLDAAILADAIGWVGGLAATVIVGLAILFSTFKIFFELLKSYISIILQVVFAPITLMMGAIPGKNVFMSWIKNMVGNLMMWPIVLICLIINRLLTSGTVAGTKAEIGGFMPPFLLGQGQGEIFPILVGIGILLVIPEIMKEAKKKLGVEDGIMGSLAGAAMKQIKQGEIALPIAGALGSGAVGGVKSISNLIMDKNSPYQKIGGLSGFINADKDQRIDTLSSMRKILSTGYYNQEKQKEVGGFKRAGQKGYKAGSDARVTLDRVLRGDFMDAENTEKYLKQLVDNQTREKQKKDEADALEKFNKQKQIQANINKETEQDL